VSTRPRWVKFVRSEGLGGSGRASRPRSLLPILRFYRVKVGTFEVTALLDGTSTFDPHWLKAANPDYRSHHTNDEWLTRDQLADVFKMIGVAVPDLTWTIEDIQTIGNQIVVRGKATGTPTGDFWGTKPTGKGFNTMAIDIFTVKNGKLASAYHVENWMSALQQIGK
jgi:predicted ester cyclase